MRLITQKQHDNLKLALLKWQEVPPQNVVPGLRQWSCGTQACFGGHVTTWPEFQAQGAYAGPDGHPCMEVSDPEPDFFSDFEVAQVLFGSSWLFDSRNQHPADDLWPDVSDHELVTKRIEWELANTGVEA